MQPQSSASSDKKPTWVWRQLKSQFPQLHQADQFNKMFTKDICFALSGDSTQKLKIELSVDIQKSPMYCDKIGWNWHKSWNFPTVAVRARILSESQQKAYRVPGQLEASLLIVKFKNNFNTSRKCQLELIKGEKKYCQSFKNGLATFENIRFQSTSFFHKKSHFFLLINISACRSQANQKESCTISTFISPPIYIDSRKQASTYHIRKKLAYSKSFETCDLQRILQNGIEQLENSQQELSNLFNYFRSAKIRNKIKHPLFLLMKFQNVMKILWNTRSAPNGKEVTLRQLLLYFHQFLNDEEYQVFDMSEDCSQKQPNLLLSKGKIFLIYVGGNNKAMKAHILKQLSILNSKYIGVVKSIDKVDKGYRSIDEMGNLLEAYESAEEDIKQLSKTLNKKIRQRRTHQQYNMENQGSDEQLPISDNEYKSQSQVEMVETHKVKEQQKYCQMAMVNKEKENINMQQICIQQARYSYMEELYILELQNYLQNLKFQTICQINRQNQLVSYLLNFGFRP